MNSEDLKPIFDAFVISDQANAHLLFIVIMLLRHKGILTEQDIEALKTICEREERLLLEKSDNLSHSPIAYFLELFGDPKDPKSMFQVIEGGKSK